MSHVNPPEEKSTWTFFSNHAHVIICLSRDTSMRMRDVAEQVGITERAVQRIVSELEAAGALSREKEGRQNRYVIDRSLPLRHELEAHRTLDDILLAVS